jgi:hypothetical protein
MINDQILLSTDTFTWQRNKDSNVGESEIDIKKVVEDKKS